MPPPYPTVGGGAEAPEMLGPPDVWVITHSKWQVVYRYMLYWVVFAIDTTHVTYNNPPKTQDPQTINIFYSRSKKQVGGLGGLILDGKAIASLVASWDLN